MFDFYHTFGWTSALVTILNIFVGGTVVALIKNRPAINKIAADREANLLNERAEEMVLMGRRIERLESERVVDRHRINNLTQCLDALLMLLEIAPDKASEHVARIKEMRAQQAIAEAAEKGKIHGGHLLDGA